MYLTSLNDQQVNVEYVCLVLLEYVVEFCIYVIFILHVYVREIKVVISGFPKFVFSDKSLNLHEIVSPVIFVSQRRTDIRRICIRFSLVSQQVCQTSVQ